MVGCDGRVKVGRWCWWEHKMKRCMNLMNSSTQLYAYLSSEIPLYKLRELHVGGTLAWGNRLLQDGAPATLQGRCWWLGGPLDCMST